VLELAGPGSVFGELAVLNGWQRSADAYALTACQLLSIEARLFTQTIARVPEAMFGLFGVLSHRLRRATEQVTDGVDLPGPQRLAKALIHLAGLYSHPVEVGLQIDLLLSQRELGAMTGLTRESINKLLAGWRDESLIRLSDGAITLLDLRPHAQGLRGRARLSSRALALSSRERAWRCGRRRPRAKQQAERRGCMGGDKCSGA